LERNKKWNRKGTDVRSGKKEQIKSRLWKEAFWSQSFCLLTTGAAPPEVIKTYIESQGEKRCTRHSNSESYIFFFNRIQNAENMDCTKNPSVAMHRSISSYTVYNGNTSFTVSNLMGILIVTFYLTDTKRSVYDKRCWTGNTTLDE